MGKMKQKFQERHRMTHLKVVYSLCNTLRDSELYRKNPRKLNAIGKPMSARESLWEWWKCERESLPAPQ